MEAETVGIGIAQRILIHKTERERDHYRQYMELRRPQRGIGVRMKQKQN